MMRRGDLPAHELWQIAPPHSRWLGRYLRWYLRALRPGGTARTALAVAQRGQPGREPTARRRWRRRGAEARQQTPMLRPMYSSERPTLMDDNSLV